MLDLPIVYEDDDVVVICKPVGVVVNRAKTVKEETIQDWMEQKLGLEPVEKKGYVDWQEVSVEDYFRERGGVVHRLDKETSGVLVLAKNPQAFESLLGQFKWRKVNKDYLALTHGSWKVKAGSINLPLARVRRNFSKVEVQVGGKVSRTDYQVIKEFRDWRMDEEVDEFIYQAFSLVRFKPSSGRTHQIRVHTQHIGHPVVGDLVYGGRKRAREDRKWAGRMLLHAEHLSFEHPVTGEKMEFHCRAKDFEEVMREIFEYRI